jgi:hypothetical protein
VQVCSIVGEALQLRALLIRWLEIDYRSNLLAILFGHVESIYPHPDRNDYQLFQWNTIKNNTWCQVRVYTMLYCKTGEQLHMKLLVNERGCHQGSAYCSVIVYKYYAV